MVLAEVMEPVGVAAPEWSRDVDQRVLLPEGYWNICSDTAEGEMDAVDAGDVRLDATGRTRVGMTTFWRPDWDARLLMDAVLEP